MKQQYVIPKANYGSLISMGIKAVTGMAKRRKEKKLRAEIEKEEQQILMASNLAEDNAILEDYPTSGLNNYGYYMANGGLARVGDPPTKKKSTNNEFSSMVIDDYNKLNIKKANLQKEINDKNTSFIRKRNAQQELNVVNKYLTETPSLVDYAAYIDGARLGIMANGGNMSLSPNIQTMGGDLVPTASGMDKAIGNTHEESKIDNTKGIKLLENGIPKVEIEDDEMIKNGQMVFSDRLKFDKNNTYAQKAEKLSKRRRKLENKLTETLDSRSKNTLERQVVGLDAKENDLFLHQEIKKVKKGITNESTTMEMGGNPTIGRFMTALDEGQKIREITKESVRAKMRAGQPLAKMNWTNIGRHAFDGTKDLLNNNKKVEALDTTNLEQGIDTTNVSTEVPTITQEEMDKMYNSITPTQSNMRKGGILKRKKGGIIPKANNGIYIDPETGDPIKYYNPETGMDEIDYAYMTGASNTKLSDNPYYQRPVENAEGTEEKQGINWKKIGETADKFVPYADNLVNAYLTSKTPKVRKPNLQRSTSLNTTHNINPALSQVRESVASISDDIVNNTSNSNVARAQLAKIKLAGMTQGNNLLTQKENIENQLKNQQTLNNQGIQAQNLAKLDRFGEAQTMRELGIQSAISRNVTDAVDDYKMSEETKAKEQYQAEQLFTEVLKYNDTGTALRSLLVNPYALERMKNDPTQLDAVANVALSKKVDGTYMNEKAANQFLALFPQYNVQ